MIEDACFIIQFLFQFEGRLSPANNEFHDFEMILYRFNEIHIDNVKGKFFSNDTCINNSRIEESFTALRRIARVL